MKKIFTLASLVALSCVAAMGEVAHAPAAKYGNTPFEYINMSNTLRNDAPKTTVDGEGNPSTSNKYAINDEYPWISYNYSASILDNGKSEVSRGGIYVSKNPVYGFDEFVYMVDDAQKWLGSPKVETGWLKNEDTTWKLCPKTISFSIKQATRADILLTGGGSNVNVADIFVFDAADNSLVKTIKSDTLVGKSNKANAGNTNSQYVTIKELDATKSYVITVAPAASAVQVEKSIKDEDGDLVKTWVAYTESENMLKDVDNLAISNIKSPSIYVAALRLYGTDLTTTMATATDFSNEFHTVGNKYPRAPFEYVNLSNTLRNDALVTSFDENGDVKESKAKYAINDSYKWINYQYSGSVLNNGNCEVARGGVYVSKNPVTMADEFVYMVDDAQMWLGSPKVEVGWTKNEDATWNLLPKTLTLNVKEMTRVDILLTGGGSNTNVADIIVRDAADLSVVKTIKSDTLVGKSNKANAGNTNSQYVTIAELDSAKSYYITIAPAASATQIEKSIKDEDGDMVKTWVAYTESENFQADVKNVAMTNIKAPTIYVAALRLFGKDLSLGNQKAPKAPADEYYSPAGNKLPGAAFAYVNLGNTICNDAPLTSFNAEGVATVANKYAVKTTYPWIYYNYTGSVLDDQRMEVARGGYYFSKNPITGADEVVYMTDDENESVLWIGSPKIEVGFSKGTTYFNKLMPKSIQFNVKEATKVEFLLTGAGSNTNAAAIKVIKASDKSVVKVISSETMAGKSNKNNGSQSNSQFIAIDELDAAESYTIVIAPDTAACQIEVSQVDEDGDAVKVLKKYSDVLASDLFSDVTVADSLKVSNIKSPAVAIGAVRVYGTDVTEDKTLGGIIAYTKAAGKKVVNLNKAFTYELVGASEADGMTINGNGASVVTDTIGQLIAKGNGLIIDNVVIDASKSTVAPIAMANKTALTAADTAAFYTEIVAKYDTIVKIDTTWNEAKTEIVKVDTTTTYNPVMGMKYANATSKCFEAKLIAIRNSEIKTATSFISGGNAPWALRTLEVNNSIIETSANSGKAFLNWEEGATQIKDIVIKNSTLYGDSANTAQRFHRYSAQADPWRVWGYEADSLKNAPGQNTWTLENNTIVNLCGNKEFSNNIKNTAATTFTFKGNVFANTWRLQKLGSNVTRNFAAADNAICGGVNSVDATDASKWATEDKEMGIAYNDSVKNFIPDGYSWTGIQKYGDPRWAAQIAERTEISRMIAGVDTLVLKSNVKYTLNAPAIAKANQVVVIAGNGASITAGEAGQFVVRQGLVLDSVKLDASASLLAPIAQAAKEDLTAADTLAFYTEEFVKNDTVAKVDTTWNEGKTEVVKVDTTYTYNPVMGMKYTNATNKVFESQLIAIRNSEVKTASSIVNGGNAPWALRTFEISNSIVETSANAGKAFLNWEEGASQIKDIVIKNSTLYGDSANTAQRFHRYSAQVDPWRVWGYEGEDKNQPGLNTWTLENNTIVNLCGNKEFSNNIKNTAATTFTFKKNVFVNSWRLQKLGSNVTRDFEATDNAIAGGVNAVDATDASKWATADSLLNIDYTFANGVDFHPGQSSYAAKIGAGDPRWAVEYVEPVGIETIAVARKSDELMFNLAGQRVNNAKGLVIKNGRKMIIK